MSEKKYTIGQMAKICNMTAEQLRHYDKIRLLSPEGRGMENDYRYYTERQIEDLMLIKELKKVGLPLKSIAGLLQNKDLKQIYTTLESNMFVQRQRLYEAQKSYDSLVDTLLRLNNAISLIQHSAENRATPDEGFSIVPISERPIIFTRHQTSCGVDDSFIYRYAELLGLAEQEKVTTSGTLFLLFHDHYKMQFQDAGAEQGDLELFTNITSSVKNVRNFRMFGGFLAATATHVGHYRYTKQVYEALEKWAVSIGYHVSGISFQELIVSRLNSNDENQYVTKIYLPLNTAAV